MAILFSILFIFVIFIALGFVANKNEKKQLDDEKMAEGLKIWQKADEKLAKLAEFQESQSAITKIAIGDVDILLNTHIKKLALKKRQTTHKDDYGNIINDNWIKELNYFIDNVLQKNQNIDAYLSYDISSYVDVINFNKFSQTSDINQAIILFKKETIEERRERLIDYLDFFVSNEISKNLPTLIDVNINELDGLDFENYCVQILEGKGIAIEKTPKTGDHGVDILAYPLGGCKVAIQCKRYNKPVGNTAVQEVYSGKDFYQASIAIVVSVSGYTRAAKQIADSLNIALLDHTELSDYFDNLLSD